jgi:serine/threonine protein kinase
MAVKFGARSPNFPGVQRARKAGLLPLAGAIMAAKITAQMEPLPGYKLMERLGSGGFGEVWKTQAPGGLLKAIKFVHGHLATNRDESDLTALQEFKALQRVKDLHHPFILSLERVDVVDGQLVIVMELADRSLWDRFQECRTQGLPGIPREELLRYLEEAAEAIDVMNQDCHVQHLDIKPQNLFLIRRHMKVADFGLAKDLEGTHAILTSGITPIYAAPETFEGRVSHFCDQYSLAIVFQELLTGKRPFNGKNARQLLIQHLKAEPDLSSLPEAYRPIVARALSKQPTERFPSCLAFIRALPREGSLGLPAPPEEPALVTPARSSAETKASNPTTPPAVPARDASPRPVTETWSGLPDLPLPGSQKARKPIVAKNSAKDTKLPGSVRKCARCGAPMAKRLSLGWCSHCGYCPTLDNLPGKGLPWWMILTLTVAAGAAACAAVVAAMDRLL